MTEFGAAASSSSSSFTYGWSYHVFLSFRGEDTRQGFTGHLYNALHKRGIRTFLDDEGIRKGEDITPTLLKAIEESKTAIVVFSKNYASSTFCLTELVQILNCMKGRNGRFIWPVFYDVDPSDIRHQTGSYKDAFDRHERVKDEKIVKDWRLALTEAANMSGWHFELEPRSKSYEYEMMEEIIGVVSKEISTGPLHIVQFSVGLESRVKEVCSLLNKQPHFDGATMVGICGIGGIGKTTIVRAVYNTIAGQFQYSCFLSNIKEKSIQDLQEILLSETIGEKDIKLNYDKRGIPIIQDRLQNKKVLLILDDIDTLDQLRALAGESNWFGFGSTIIITTRDRSLLKNHEVERLYEVKELTCEEARQLLILNAFKNKEANPGYAKVIQRAVEYASGLPLVLEILGSNFHICQTIEEWETALDIYEKIPDKTVQKILKVSYDGLGEKQREIFLDIACFYRGQPLEDAIKILSASHDIGVEFCIRELIEKSLIKIGDDSYLDMHDLIQDMGQEIVRQESPIDVGRRSRLWSSKDILHVLKENTGTATIQAMNLLFNFKGKEVEWSGESFEKMKNLRLLSFCRGVMFSQGPKCLPNSLRVVQWDHYPSSTLPDNFCPINLVILRLRYSHLKTLGKAFKNFNNLRQLNLAFSKDLEELPDISGAVNLEELEVSYCQNLTKIDDSVGRLTKLRMLNAQRCISLDTFIVKGMELVSLEVLNLSYCFELHTFPKILVPMKNIKTFDMSHTAIKTLPESIEKLDALERLSNNYHRFDQPDLRTLYLVNCLQLQEIREVPPNIKIFSLTSSSIRTLLKQNCCNLRELDLSYNKNLEEFPDISEAVNLEVLDVSYCKKLTKIDDSVGHFAKLRILNAKKCINLDTFIVKGIKLVSLEILNLSNCSNFHIFPEILVTMEKIETLDLSYTAIKILPESIEKLIALETLCLSDSTELRQLPNLACRNLKRLDLNGCKKLEEIKGISQDIEVFSAKNCTSLTSCTTRLLLRQKFFNLRSLILQGCENLEELPNISGAANLEELDVSYCKKLTKIDDSIGHLTKLRVLDAKRCEMLDTFIVGGIMLVSLEILNLRCCYKLHTFPEILATMENIVKLDLGHTAIKLLPESMEKLVALERLWMSNIKGDLSNDRDPFRFDESTLYLDGCDQLQEIRKIPPNIEVFFAENCKSLTSSLIRALLKQDLQETRKTEFILPGNEIPKWLHKHSTRGSVSFWIRRKLPQIALCAVVTGGPTIFSSFVMYINGVTEYVVGREKIEIEKDHIFLFDLRHFEKRVKSLNFGFQLWDLRVDVASELLAKEWNHVKFSLEGRGTESRLKYIGVYVYNYDSCMEDILFENPIPQERIQVEAVHKIGFIIWDNNEEDLQQQQQLTSINQQTSESFEIVGKAKVKSIIVHGGDANEEKDKIAFEVTCQNWDPMIWQYGSTCQKDQSTIIDEGHDGCDPMEWEYQFTPLKGHDGCDPMEWEYQLTHLRDQSTIIDLQRQQHLSDINQQVSKSSENFKKAKGKNIIVYGDNTSEEKDSNTLEKDQSAINDKGHHETKSHKARVTCFDLFSYLVSLCSSSAAS